MDDNLKQLLLQSAQADVDFFSNAGKKERERLSVSEFLSTLGIAHDKHEIVSLEQDNKIDVRYKDASFQVKELMDPDQRRTKMYKDIRNSIRSATTLQEIRWIGDVHSIPPLAAIYDLVLDEAKKLANDSRYERVKHDLDLLFYVTRTFASLINEAEINSGDFSPLGWRSVSCVNAKQAVVLFASPTAPEFLRSRTARVSR